MKFSNENIKDYLQRINDASKEERSETVLHVMQEMLDEAESSIVEQYRAMAEQVNIDASNAQRYGIRQLSADEKAFYQQLTSGSITADTQSDLIPTTLVNYVFEDLRRQRPLFEFIDWTPAGVKKWFTSEKNGTAKWGELTATIADEVKGEIKVIDLEAHKLSAFSLIPLAIIDLGWDWVDKYFREILLEANEEGLEEGIVAGTGKNGPIGIIRKLTGAVDGVHAERTATAITTFEPVEIGPHLANLTNNGKRIVPEVVLICNPVDYFTKVMPATQMLTSGGEYRTVFPYNVKFVQAIGVPSNRVILMLPNAYAAGISRMGISKSDEYKFLDDARTYKIVTYGNGRIKKEDMAVYLDITNLKPLAFNVNVVNQTQEDTGA